MDAGYSLMNVSKRAAAESTTMRDRLAAWRELLVLCGRKATRKHVHALRVVTLRLQAELERDLADLPRASHQAQTILRFGKQAEKLRRALGPVRELDVWIGKLRGLRVSLSETEDYVPRSAYDCISAIDRLEIRLTKKRRTAEKQLIAQIEKLHGSLFKASEKVEGELSDLIFGEDAGIAEALVARFRAIYADFPRFDEQNLHEFRKSIKPVRYLAEIHAGANRACAQIARQVKKAQSAIGEWHDWQELGREAHHGNHAKTKPLAELLDTVSAESFETALSKVQSVSAHLLDQTDKPEGFSVASGKLPAHGDLHLVADLKRKLA